MKRIRRNAFALSKKEEISPEPPQLEQVFGVAPKENSVELDHHAEDDDKPFSHLTHEQITGKAMKAKVKLSLKRWHNQLIIY